MSRASDGVWHQRHIWLNIPSLGGELKEPAVDPWIVGSQLGPTKTMHEIKKEQSE